MNVTDKSEFSPVSHLKNVVGQKTCGLALVSAETLKYIVLKKLIGVSQNENIFIKKTF